MTVSLCCKKKFDQNKGDSYCQGKIKQSISNVRWTINQRQKLRIPCMVDQSMFSQLSNHLIKYIFK